MTSLSDKYREFKLTDEKATDRTQIEGTRDDVIRCGTDCGRRRPSPDWIEGHKKKQETHDSVDITIPPPVTRTQSAYRPILSTLVNFLLFDLPKVSPTLRKISFVPFRDKGGLNAG